MAVLHGVRAVLSTSLLVNDAPIGALNLDATAADAFTRIETGCRAEDPGFAARPDLVAAHPRVE